MLSSSPIFRIEADVGEIQRFGNTPYGERRVIDITGGLVHGRRLSGRILPGGTDRQIIRTDGVTDLTARYSIATDSGGLVLVNSDGLRHGPPEVLAAIARGEPVSPDSYYFRSVMRFETSDPACNWLNRIIALATGTREQQRVLLDVYEVV
jgi:hypothetical protein